jgi:flagellin
MGLRINTNVAALNASRTLARTTGELNRSLERLSSGLRINRARDDAAGLAIAEGFRSVVRGAIVAGRNTQDGINLVQTAEGALAETTSILQRIRELALQSANGTQTTTNQLSIDNEVQQLLAQIDDIAFDTEFNGLNVLSIGNVVTLQSGFQQGQTLVVSVGNSSAKGLSVDKVNVSITSTAVKAISQVDIALQSVNSLRATLGAQQNRLEFTIRTLAIQEENSAASESAIRDADIARETTQFTRNQILLSAGTSVLAQANIIPQTALQLLG